MAYRYSQTSPGCLRLTVEDYRAFVRLLSPAQLAEMLRSSDGMLRAVASWRYYWGR